MATAGAQGTPHYPTGCQQEFSPLEDVHTVASLLKLYLRELPEPLVPFVYYDKFQTVMRSKLHRHWYAPGFDLVVDSCLCSVGEWCGHCCGGTTKTAYSATKSQLQYFKIRGVSCFLMLSLLMCFHDIVFLSTVGSCMACKSTRKTTR